MKQKEWVLSTKSADQNKIEELVTQGIHRVIAEMLVVRGVDTPEKVKHFFEDTLKDRANPFLMKGVDIAVQRILLARERQEKVVIYGDYDVDGITSTSVMLRCLRALGLEVDYYIPDRLEEGYGLHAESLEKIRQEGCGLLITVDCGIASREPIEQYREYFDVIVTDHHQPPNELPNAVAVINPKQADCQYPEKELAGVGVAYTLCRGLWLAEHQEDYTNDIELVALGTIADVMALLQENRIYVRYGLERMAHTENIGLQALLQACKVDPENVTSERVGYSLAPRLNAAGRVAHAGMGVRLLTSMDAAEAQKIAEELLTINTERQTIERNLLQEAEERNRDLGDANRNVLVIDGRNWHPGVIGIVASRLVEKYDRPAILISVHDGIGKGSCRSIPALNIYEALGFAKDLLLQYGGHHQAAGFSVAENKIPELRARLQEYADLHLKPEDYYPILEIERKLSAADVSLELVHFLDSLEPYGEGNPSPVFATDNLDVKQLRRIGADRRHVKMCVGQGESAFEVVGWGMNEVAEEVFEEDRIDIAYTLQVNEWQGNEQVQAVLKDVHLQYSHPIEMNRDILIQIYKELRQLLRDRDRMQAQVEILLTEQTGSDFSRKVVVTALKIFSELGIILTIVEDNTPYYRWGQVDQKLDLSSSITYLKATKGG